MPDAIQLRLDADATPVKDPIWTFGTNTCHAPLWLRDDMLRQMERSRRELGFRFVRCHGKLNSSMVDIRSDGSFDFARLHAALDRLLNANLKPFFGIYAMPNAMCQTTRTIAAYRLPTSPPADWAEWYRLVRDLMASLVSRYGLAELRQWYFEVWNEPDIDFWTGTQAEFFRLYDIAARAVKETDPQLRIGGPGTARTAWMREFGDHVLSRTEDYPLDVPRCDYISTHLYPSDLDFLEAARGDVTLLNSNIMSELFRDARREIDARFGAFMPLICGEWNSSAGPLATNHDECNNAPFIVKTMVDLTPYCMGQLYWALSDIYEESGFHYEPFHGGYGLLTVNDLPKSSYHAFRMLNEHAGSFMRAHLGSSAPGGAGCVASRNEAVTRLTLYYYLEPDAHDAAPVDVQLPTDVASAAKSATLERVEPGAGSAYETWLDLGKPTYLNRPVFDALERASQTALAPVDPRVPIRLKPGTVAQVTIHG